MRSVVFFSVVTVIVLAGIIILLRSLKLKEKYAALWILVGTSCLVLVAFPPLLSSLAQFVGVQVGSNLLFMAAILLVLGVCLQLSLEISSQEDKIRRLAEETAILRAMLEEPCVQEESPCGLETPQSDVHGSSNEEEVMRNSE